MFTASSTSNDGMFSAPMNDNDAKMFTPPISIETQVFTAKSIVSSSVSPTLNDTTNTFQHGGSPLQPNAMPSALAHNSMGQSPLGQR